jgi:hypothetical protein
LTAHKTAIAYHVSTRVARWHARTCKAVVYLKAVQTPYERHSLTPCRAQFCSQAGLRRLRWSSSAPEMATISQTAPLKMHS